MAWQYQIDEARKIFILEFLGEMTAEDIRESTILAIKLQKERKILRYYSDLRDVLITSTLNDIYSLASNLYTELGAHPLVRYAILPPKDEMSRKVVELYAVTSQHRDRMIQVFETKEEAYKWLLEKKVKF